MSNRIIGTDYNILDIRKMGADGKIKIHDTALEEDLKLDLKAITKAPPQH